MELLADERLRLTLVGRDQVRLRLHPEAERLVVAVEYGVDVPVGEIVDHVGVELLRHLARQRAGEHDQFRTL